ncbi:MAG: hypothetical protein RQ748_00735 [Elusimicrobiales bacterium]|nr:hypothetical protein [Elusimicrobiales bacterium]
MLFKMRCTRAIILFIVIFLPFIRPSAAEEPGEDYHCRGAKKDFFTAPGDDGLVFPGRRGSIKFSFKMPKPSGLTRIFIAGESAAALMDSGEGFFEEQNEVINCGMGGVREPPYNRRFPRDTGP